MDCIKGNSYRLDEFLFGYKVQKDEKSQTSEPTMTEAILKSALARGNKVLYAVIYLAP